MKLRTKLLTSLACTTLYSLFILPITEHVAFTIPASRSHLVLSYVLKLLFAVVLFFLTYFVLTFVERWRAKDPFYRRWLKYGSIYFAVMFIFYLLNYPGHWVNDEFNVLANVQMYGVDGWQNYFTNIFYTFCLYLIPTGGAIIFIQISVISTIVGYITAGFEQLFKRKALAYGLLVPLFFLPVIFNNLYPLRGALSSFVELLLLSKLLFEYYGTRKIKNRYVALVQYSVLIMLVSFWRSESIYYLALFPLIVWYLGIFRKPYYRQVLPYAVVLGCAVLIWAGGTVTKMTSRSSYELTAMLNPLSTMLQQPLKGDNIDERLKIMDQTVNIATVKAYPSHTEIPSFWNGAVRPDYLDHMSEFKKQYVYLVLHNPGLFLDNRIDTFMSTSGFDRFAPAGESRFDRIDYLGDSLVANFVQTNRFSKPFNVPLRAQVTSFLLYANPGGTQTFLGRVFWNHLIPLALITAVTVWALIKRRWVWLFVTGLVLARVVIIFLTAPANYFFYYLPLYVSGYFLAALALLLYVDHRKNKSSTR